MVQLKSEAEPVLTIGRDEFQEQVSDGEFWGVPVKYFRIENDEVYLKSSLASELSWNIEEVVEGWVNMNALSQQVTVDGETLYINPGFCCSRIEESYLGE
jgi:hypothetical protein